MSTVKNQKIHQLLFRKSTEHEVSFEFLLHLFYDVKNVRLSTLFRESALIGKLLHQRKSGISVLYFISYPRFTEGKTKQNKTKLARDVHSFIFSLTHSLIPRHLIAA